MARRGEIWDSDYNSSSDEGLAERIVDGCNSFPDGNVMLGKNVPLIKDNEKGILRTESFREYLAQVEEFEDLRSMFISMILDLKERVKGCEHCETCSQVIELVEMNIKICKKVSKLAHGFANVFMYLIRGNIPDKLNENSKHLLNVVFILLVKNSKFPDVQYIHDKFKAFINPDAFEGLALRLAIQKYRPADIRIMLREWGCDPTVRNHRPIIRAFHYEKFGVVRTLIELGSSYKYYLQKDLPATEYQTFQKVIDKYLARDFPNSSEIEKEFRIVEMINDFRHILLEEDAAAAIANNEEIDSEYNPISTDYFLEDFMQYFYEKTGISSSEKNKNKKKNKKKKKQKQKQSTPPLEQTQQLDEIPLQSKPELEPEPEPQTYSQIPISTHPNEKVEIELDSNQYDSMNDETFNLGNENIISNLNTNNMELILLDTYFTDKITAYVPTNQIHLGNWHPSCSMQDSSIWNFWDNHFQNVFYQYSY